MLWSGLLGLGWHKLPAHQRHCTICNAGPCLKCSSARAKAPSLTGSLPAAGLSQPRALIIFQILSHFSHTSPPVTPSVAFTWHLLHVILFCTHVHTHTIYACLSSDSKSQERRDRVWRVYLSHGAQDTYQGISGGNRIQGQYSWALVLVLYFIGGPTS